MIPVSPQLSARLPGRGYATPMQRPGRPARRLAAPPKAFDLSAIDLSAIQTSFADAAAYKAPPSEEATTSVEIALGLLGLSFVGTFLVLPRFSSLFKDEIQWNDIYPELVKDGAEEVDAAEAAAMTKRGAIIVDVRLERKRQNYAIENSASAPLYRPITGMGVVSNLRRLAFGFFGVYGTERNPDFLTELEKNAEKDQEVILVCEMGGSLEQKPGATTGFQSRSLKAMHIARKAGFKKLYYLKNGVSAWARMESPEGFETKELQRVGS